MKKERSPWSQTILNPARQTAFVFRTHGMFCASQSCLMGALLQRHPSFLMNGSMCLQMNSFMSLFLAYRSFVVQQAFFFHILCYLWSKLADSVSASVTFSGILWVFCACDGDSLHWKIGSSACFPQITPSLFLASDEMAEGNPRVICSGSSKSPLCNVILGVFILSRHQKKAPQPHPWLAFHNMLF